MQTLQNIDPELLIANKLSGTKIAKNYPKTIGCKRLARNDIDLEQQCSKFAKSLSGAKTVNKKLEGRPVSRCRLKLDKTRKTQYVNVNSLV